MNQKKAPIKGLFRFALRSVLTSPVATLRVGTVNAIEITVYPYIIYVKRIFSDCPKPGKRYRVASHQHSPFEPTNQIQDSVRFHPGT
jgi:hypothetical protein